ncbi:hypothetical protein HK099_004591 [Clydaea vesicula]|uniref:Uncharacterized protein n=1 Tax=Clydaea vesicula TaxID=447962 RepID=A0AAD5U9R0_9FUNG|nr:hypothetical protein HK099_004591 [Clydaea vesicula]
MYKPTEQNVNDHSQVPETMINFSNDNYGFYQNSHQRKASPNLDSNKFNNQEDEYKIYQKNKGTRDNSILIGVNSQIYNYENKFNHPWQLLYFTRRCRVQCNYVALDKKFGKYFTQNKKEHQWLTKEQGENLMQRADAFLISSENYTAKHTEKYLAVIEKRLPNYEYNHKNLDDLTATSDDLQYDGLKFEEDFTVENSNENVIWINENQFASNITFNFITNTYRDLGDFRERLDLMNLKLKNFNKTNSVIAFLPKCSNLHESHLKYIKVLSSLVEIYFYSGCFSIEIPEPLKLNDEKKMLLVSKYKFVLQWDTRYDFGVVSEQFFQYLTYDTVIIFFGALNIKEFLPKKGTIIEVRRYEDPNELGNLVKDLMFNDIPSYEKMLNWKRFDALTNNAGNLKIESQFQNLFSNSVESVVCRLCENVKLLKKN